MSIEAMKQALEALDAYSWEQVDAARAALRTAVERAEKQEPFGYFQYSMHIDAWVQNRDSNKGVAFYTTPPAAHRPWVGLTEPELHEINPTWPAPNEHWKYQDVLAFVRAVEEKLKGKNA